MNSHIPWLAYEPIRETTGQHPCDARQPISVQKVSYEHIDFSLIKSDTDDLYSIFEDRREPFDHVAMRGREFLEFLASRQESEVLVVTHSSWLKTFYLNGMWQYNISSSKIFLFLTSSVIHVST